MGMPALNLLGSTAPVVFNPTQLDKAIVNAARDLYSNSVKLPDGTPVPSQLSDDAVWAFAVKYRSQYPNADDAELHRYMVKSMYEAMDADNGPVEADTKSPPDTRIANMVRVLNSDVEFKALIDSGVDAYTTSRNIGRDFTRILFADFCTVNVGGKVLPWSTEHATLPFDMGVMNEWPEPGLVASEKLTRPNTGWDVERKVIDGKSKPVGFYRTAVEKFAAGERINAEIAELTKATIDPPSGKYKETYSAEGAQSEIDLAKRHLEYMAELLRDAVRLIRQIHAVNELGHIKAYLIVNRNRMADGTTRLEFTNGPNKIAVQETHDGGERYPCTIATFMRFSPNAAAQKGGTLSALRESAKPPESTGNGTMAGQGDTKADQFPKVSAINFAMASQNYANYLNEAAGQLAIRQRWNDKDETKSDAEIVAAGDATIGLFSVFRVDLDYIRRYEKLKNLQPGEFAELLGIKQKDGKPVSATPPKV